MIVMAIILIMLGLFVAGAKLLLTIGLILLVAGLVMNLLSLGGRRWY